MRMNLSTKQVAKLIENYEVINDGTFAIVGQRFLIELFRVDEEIYVVETWELKAPNAVIFNYAGLSDFGPSDFELLERAAFDDAVSAHAFFGEFIAQHSHHHW